jgi:hypothetical protein
MKAGIIWRNDNRKQTYFNLKKQTSQEVPGGCSPVKDHSRNSAVWQGGVPRPIFIGHLAGWLRRHITDTDNIVGYVHNLSAHPNIDTPTAFTYSTTPCRAG